MLLCIMLVLLLLLLLLLCSVGIVRLDSLLSVEAEKAEEEGDDDAPPPVFDGGPPRIGDGRGDDVAMVDISLFLSFF